MVALHNEYTRALTFENLSQAVHAGGWAYGAAVGGLRAKVLQKYHRRYSAFAVLTALYALWQS